MQGVYEDILKMSRRIKWDRRLVERARDLQDRGFSPAEVRDALRDEGSDVPYFSVIDWLKFATRTRPMHAERGNL